MSLRSFLTRLVWLCVLPLAALAVYLAIGHVLAVHEERRSEAAGLARNAARLLDRDLQGRLSALEVLATSPMVDDPRRWPDLYIEAKGFARSFGGNVIFADLNRQMLFNTRVPFGAPLPKLPTVRPHAAADLALISGQPAVGDRFIGPVAKIPLVAIAVPVIRDHRIVYLMLTILETDLMQRQLDRVTLPTGWCLSLVDGKNARIAANSQPQCDATSQPDASLFIAHSELSAWSIILSVPQHAFMTPIAFAALTLLAALFAAIVVSVVGGRLASRRLSRSIQALAGSDAQQDWPCGIAEIDIARERLVEAATARELARQQAEQAVVAKSSFLASASHDLRQPFQAMQLYCDVLDARLAEPGDRKVLGALLTAMRAGQELLSALLHVSTLEAGIVRPTFATVPLASVLTPLANDFALQARAKQLEFRHVPCTATVRTDPVLLAQMVRNLLSNALKYTNQGCILIGCRRIRGRIRIEVWDTGPGVAAKDQNRIWEDFVQLHNPERDRSRGLGLGLTVVAKTGRLLGHPVGLESRPGRGSVFFVEVGPALPQDLAATPPRVESVG